MHQRECEWSSHRAFDPPIVGFNRLLDPWSKMACKASKASFFVFHASLFASVRIVVPFSNPSISTLGNSSSRGSPALPLPDKAVGPVRLATSAEVRLGSGAGFPSTLSNSPTMVLRSCGLRSSKKSLMPRGGKMYYGYRLQSNNSPEPANNLTVTRAFVPLDRTAAFEFFRAVLRNSMRARNDTPAMPNSVSA
jgi:hypothetical protein